MTPSSNNPGAHASSHRRASLILLAGVLMPTTALVPTLSANEPASSPAASAVGAVSATGSIVGRVQDARTGAFLSNARVRTSSGQEAFTDSYGFYRIDGVPAGAVSLTAFYSGLEARTVSVDVPSGASASPATIVLGARGADGQEVVQLDEAVVTADRMTDVAAIAINEQRFAPNVKTVIEAGAFGDVTEGNVGEFLKYLPGVTVDYVAADVRTALVRGFPSAYSSVSLDGFRAASAASGSATRAFEFEQVSMNNAARIEVSKVPLPSMPADSLGGGINMIGKNAFEREGHKFSYRASVNVNSDQFELLSRTPGPARKDTYKTLPGFDFDYTAPIIPNTLGLVVTGLTSNQFNPQHRSQPLWNYAQGGATAANPFLQQYQMQDGPKNTYRNSLSLKTDWRINDSSVFWVGAQTNHYKTFFGNRNVTFDTGTASTPSTTGGASLSFGEDFTNGASGRGSVRHGTSFRDKLGSNNLAMAKYRYNKHGWDVDLGAGMSKSKSWYRDTAKGHFSEIRTTLQGVSRVNYADIGETGPGTVTALNSAGTAIDYNNLANYRINTVRSQPLDASDAFQTFHTNVRRDIDGLPFDLALKVGAEIRRQERDIKRTDRTWNFVGADGVANTADDSAAAYADIWYQEDAKWGFGKFNWPSPYALYDAFLTNPAYFQSNDTTNRNAERFRIQNSQLLEETVTSVYLQAEAGFLDNKLKLVGGARFEGTSNDGKGPLTPTAGATLADIAANWVERGLSVSKSYDGIYPSLHATYSITDDLLLRVAWAQTLGRPDFGVILPLARINETASVFNDGIGDIPANTVILNNTGLEPWEAQNYDVSLEYYFRNGGVFSVGAFYKEIDGFFELFDSVATAQQLEDFGLDPTLQGITVRTRRNSTQKASITGGEVNYRQRLDFIPQVGKYLTFFANGTQLELDGSATADFTGFIKTSANTGIIVDVDPVTFRVNVNYRGRQMGAVQTGAAYGTAGGVFREYFEPRTSVDLNGEFEFNKHFVLFANVRNVFNVKQNLLRYSPLSADYAQLYRSEDFGIQFTFGVKGSF